MPTTSTNKPVYRLHYLNNLGAMESFNFEKVATRTTSVDRSTYKKAHNPSEWSGMDAPQRNAFINNNNYYTKVSEVIKVRSGWLTEEMQNELEQLISSPVVYWDREGYGVDALISVNITNSSFEYKTKQNKKMFDLEIEFKINDRYRQRY